MNIDDSLGYLLNTAARLIKRRLDADLKAHGVTTAQWAVLKLLSQADGLTQAEIAQRLHGDAATAGAVVDKLVAKGFAQRNPVPGDRRAYRVTLAEPARPLVAELTNHAAAANRAALRGLDAGQAAALAAALTTVITTLEEDHDSQLR